MSVEFVSRVHNFDGLAMIASCDNIIAGCYLAVMRLDIPSMIVTEVPVQPGQHCGKTVVEADLDGTRFSGATEEELMEMKIVCVRHWSMPIYGNSKYDADAGRGIESGTSGTLTYSASDNKKLRKAREAGKYAVEMARAGRKPSELITKEVLLNSIMFDMAVAGSTNAVLHILSYAYELGIKLTLEDFEKYAKEIPFKLMQWCQAVLYRC